MCLYLFKMSFCKHYFNKSAFSQFSIKGGRLIYDCLQISKSQERKERKEV